MSTSKNLLCRRGLSMALAAVTLWLAGCGPPGPRAMLEGKRLLEQGNYEDAIEELKVAAQLHATNGLVWDYLGLAYQRAGQVDASAQAYQKALRLNHELVVVHFNLGCLWLEAGRSERLEDARNELTAFTLRQGNSAPGFVKLGEAELRLRNTPEAERCFRQALQITSNSAEAMNGLGIVEWQRSRYRDSAAWFTNSLAHQPGFGPALLNLAIVSQSYLGNRTYALQRYNDYLSLSPRPTNWDAVNVVAHELAQELNPPPRALTNTSPTLTGQSIGTARSGPNNGSRGTGANSNGTRGELAYNPRASTYPAAHTADPRETESAGQAPRSEVSSPTSPATESAAPAQQPVAMTQSDGDTAANDTPKPGFLQRINPFRHPTTPVATPAPQPEATPNDIPPATDQTSRGIPSPRYNYVWPPKPVEGNLAEAERFFARAAQAQSDHRSKDAVALYREATEADPAFFEAEANLGLAAYESGDLTQSLLAYETALAIRPDSFSARFKFGLALGKAGYIQDAAQELERALAAHPEETAAHLAMAHLALANLYADQFHQPAYARPHYQKVLELDPDNSQTSAIQFWLRANP